MSDPFIGEIVAVGFYFDQNGFSGPGSWLPCDGRLLQIAAYTPLFSLIGTTYGGDGRTTFALPNLNGTTNGRLAIGQGQGPGLSQRTMGQAVGAMTVTLTRDEMPSHVHAMRLGPTGAAGASSGPGQPGASVALDPSFNGFVQPQPDTAFAANAIAYDGGGEPHANDQPTTGLWYCIAVEGIFPPFP